MLLDDVHLTQEFPSQFLLRLTTSREAGCLTWPLTLKDPEVNWEVFHCSCQEFYFYLWFELHCELPEEWTINKSFFLISGLSESLLPDRSPPPPHATIKDLNLRHNSGPGWLKMDTMDGGHSGRTSKLYSPSGPSGGATTLPKDPPLYISIVQLISYVGSSLSHCIFPLCPRDSLCLF